jgi:hypothetical protein
MGTALVTALISSTVPLLVREAEAKFGSGKGSQKRQWVIDGVHAGIQAIEKHVDNSTVNVVLDSTEPLIDAAINFVLDKGDVN